LTLPPSEPGYYFWRDRTSKRITRRSEWFTTKSPSVTIGTRAIKYMISFALPRFCDQTLDRSRKERFYPGADAWIAKLDTVVHELYHIDPQLAGIRRIENQDGTYSGKLSRPAILRAGRRDGAYLPAQPAERCGVGISAVRLCRARSEIRRSGCDQLPHVSVVSTALHRAARRLSRRAMRMPKGIAVESLDPPAQPTQYTEDDLHIGSSPGGRPPRVIRKGAFRAA
jgi:hypothetical protein